MGSCSSNVTAQDQLKLLVVDNDHNDLALLAVAIEKTDLPIQMQSALDADQAIEYLTGVGKFCDRLLHPLPELVLLDLRMQRADGFDFLRWRLLHPEFKAIPVILFTGSTDPNLLRQAHELYLDYYIAKPLRFDEWRGVVHRAWEWFHEWKQQHHSGVQAHELERSNPDKEQPTFRN